MSDTRVTVLEEKLAYLTATVDEMSDVIARQADEIALLTNRVRMLMEREAEREVAEGSTVPLADQRPPHW